LVSNNKQLFIRYENVVQLTFLFFYVTFMPNECRCLHVLCLWLVAVCQLFLYEYMDMGQVLDHSLLDLPR